MQKEVSHLLLNYLASHSSLALAGIGCFTRAYRPAHFVGNQLKAPGSIFYFDADQSLKENSPALTHAFKSFNLQEENTNQSLRAVFEEITKELGQQKRFSYPGLGTFERESARIEFKPDPLHYFDAFAYGLESVLVRTNIAEDQSPVKETSAVVKVEVRSKSTHFWLKVAAAVLLLMVANLGVLFYLDQQGHGNQQMQRAEVGNFDSVQLPIVAEGEISPVDKTEQIAGEDSLKTEPSSNLEQTYSTKTNELVVNRQFTVIVGAFREAANADKYIQDLKNIGYVEAASAGTTNSGLHRVSVAKFSSQEMAEAYLEEIKLKLQADAWIMN